MTLVNLTDKAKEHLKNLAKDHNKKYVRLEVKEEMTSLSIEDKSK